MPKKKALPATVEVAPPVSKDEVVRFLLAKKSEQERFDAMVADPTLTDTSRELASLRLIYEQMLSEETRSTTALVSLANVINRLSNDLDNRRIRAGHFLGVEEIIQLGRLWGGIIVAELEKLDLDEEVFYETVDSLNEKLTDALREVCRERQRKEMR